MSSREHLNLPWFNAVRILYGYARQNLGVVLVVGFGIFCIVTSVLVPMHSLFYFLYGPAWTKQVLCSDVESIGEISSQEGVSKVTDTPSNFLIFGDPIIQPSQYSLSKIRTLSPVTVSPLRHADYKHLHYLLCQRHCKDGIVSRQYFQPISTRNIKIG